jgi:polyferredoxin
MPNSSRKPLWMRSILQAFFFLLIALIAVNHFLDGAIPIVSRASLHGVCPFGGVVSLYQFLTEGTFVRKIQESSFISMILVFGLAVLFGPVFCGWVCPLGTFQEWVGKLGRKFSGKKFNHLIPYRIDKWLRYLRYLVLAWVLYVTSSTAVLMFSEFDPYYALFNFWTGEVAAPALVILAVTTLLSLFVERPWCKYACPYGALLGISNLFRVFSIRRETNTCVECGICRRDCPMNIPVDRIRIVRDHQCISCLECTSETKCPVVDTVVFAAGKGN